MSESLLDWVRREGAKITQKERDEYVQNLFEARKNTISDIAFERARQHDEWARPNAKVYFARESLNGAIKIGVSENVQKRVRELGQGTPYTVTVLAEIKGAHGVEGLMHLLFSHARIRGEWFHPVPELLEYIEGLPK